MYFNRWFKHFYYFAAPLSCAVLTLAFFKYFHGTPTPEFVYWILDILYGHDRQPSISSECALLAMFLLTVQCCKRWYETNYISVFSNAKMNISHYLVGFIHYIGVITCIIGEADGFVRRKYFI